MDRKEEILEAAFNLFSERGCRLSMADIAEQVGIKTPSLYSHFKNKDEIIYLMIEKLVDELFDLIVKTFNESKSLGCEETLKNIFFTAMRFNTIKRLKVYRRLPFIENDSLRRRCVGVMRERESDFLGKLYTLIQEAVQNGEIYEATKDGVLTLFMAMLQGNMDGKLLYQDFENVETFIKKSWVCFCRGIRRRTETDCECFHK